MKDLIWHRQADGSYRTEVTGDVEFHASARKVGGDWHLVTYTFGQVLHSEPHDTLALAKADADLTYRNVEGVMH